MAANLLESKVVVITGAAGLIGRTFSKIAAEHGARLVLLDTDLSGAIELATDLIISTQNAAIRCSRCDITSSQSVDKAISNVLEFFGRIDVLVNNAYPKNQNYGRGPEQITYTDFCDHISSHLGGYFLMIQKVMMTMIERGSGNIINMGSIYGFSAPKFEIYEGTDMTTPAEYAAAKGGIINLTRYFASYLGPYGIRVNALSPGGVFNNQPDSFVSNYEMRVPLGGIMADPDDLIGPFLFLASDMSKYVTGQNIVVDGGFTL